MINISDINSDELIINEEYNLLISKYNNETKEKRLSIEEVEEIIIDDGTGLDLIKEDNK